MRISKADGSQVLDLQHDALLAAGIEPDHIYQDKASGSKDDRPGLASCLKALRKGDVLVIWKLDRLGRNLKHLIETVEDLSKRGVGFKVIQGAPINTTTSVVQSRAIDPSDPVCSQSRMACQDASAGNRGYTVRCDMGALNSRSASWPIRALPQSGDHLSKLKSLLRRAAKERGHRL
jgi:hypothetical protein